MDVIIFGKTGCARCKSTKNKVTHLLARWGVSGNVNMDFVDLDTIDGLAEGSFHDVFDVPVTIVKREGTQVARWDGIVPDSQELRGSLESGPASAGAQRAG